MNQPTYLQQPNVVRLPTLLAEVARGEIRIPRFQRRFIWSDEQRLLLLSSIYQGMPIGSILVWRTRSHDLETFARLGDLRVVPAPQRAEAVVKQYLLDGHQRLTTLYAALGKGLSASQQVEENEEDESWSSEQLEIGESRRAIYFDLETRDFELEPTRGEAPPTWLPLSLLFDPYELYEFQKRLTGLPEGRKLLNRAESLASTFKDYSIPIVPIVSEDLELVTESFQRINSAGTKMDIVSMVNALLWSPEFDVNDRLGEIKNELAEVGWGDLDEQTILNICKAALGLDLYGSSVREIKTALLGNQQILDDAANLLKVMAAFLARRCNILGPATLPYRYQAVLLADAIRVATRDAGQELSEATEEALQRWLWLTTYGEYFAGINYSRLRKTLEHLRRVAEHGADPKPPDLTIEVTPWRRFDFRTARSRAILLRMADELDPRGPEGEPQEPFGLLAEHGKDAAPLLIPSRTIGDRRAAEGVENRILAHPKNAGPLRRKLLGGDCETEILRSHGIEAEAEAALREGNLDTVLALRYGRLAEIERRFVESLGFDYLDERT